MLWLILRSSHVKPPIWMHTPQSMKLVRRSRQRIYFVDWIVSSCARTLPLCSMEYSSDTRYISVLFPMQYARGVPTDLDHIFDSLIVTPNIPLLMIMMTLCFFVLLFDRNLSRGEQITGEISIRTLNPTRSNLRKTHQSTRFLSLPCSSRTGISDNFHSRSTIDLSNLSNAYTLWRCMISILFTRQKSTSKLSLFIGSQ